MCTAVDSPDSVGDEIVGLILLLIRGVCGRTLVMLWEDVIYILAADKLLRCGMMDVHLWV